MVRNRISHRFRMVALVVASAVFGSLVTGTSMVVADQGNMVAARQSIKAAINYLNAATPDKGGHRANALNLAQQALVEINRGIGYANHH